MEGQNAGTLDYLNDDCLLHIFYFLPFPDLIRIERVCKRWREISLMAWRNLEISITNKYFSKKYLQLEHLEKIFQRCKNYVTHLQLNRDLNYLDPNDVFEMIDKNCKKLTHLDVGGLEVTDKELDVENFPFLKRLKSFYGCVFTIDLEELTMNKMLTFLEKTELTEFHISNETEGDIRVEDGGKKIHICGIEMSAIEDLNLDRLLARFSQVEDLTIVTVPPFRMYKHLASVSSQLKSLVVANNWHDFLEGTDYKRLQLKNLRELDLSYNSCVNDEVISVFVQMCPLLEEIDFSGCDKVTDSGLRQLGNLKELLVLKIAHSEICSETLLYLAAHCSKLQKIYYNHYQNTPLNDVELINVVSLLPDLRYVILHSVKNLTKKCLKSIFESVQQRINGVKLEIELNNYEKIDREMLSLKRKDEVPSAIDTCLAIVIKEITLCGQTVWSTQAKRYYYCDE